MASSPPLLLPVFVPLPRSLFSSFHLFTRPPLPQNSREHTGAHRTSMPDQTASIFADPQQHHAVTQYIFHRQSLWTRQEAYSATELLPPTRAAGRLPPCPGQARKRLALNPHFGHCMSYQCRYISADCASCAPPNREIAGRSTKSVLQPPTVCGNESYTMWLTFVAGAYRLDIFIITSGCGLPDGTH